MKPQYLSALVADLLEVAATQSSFLPVRLSALHLAVKSLYMSIWQQAGSDGGDGGYLAGQWPTFYDWIGVKLRDGLN